MLLLAAALSSLIGISLGMLGGGGSILTVPILVYALDVDPKAAIATSLVVVGVTSAVGAAQHHRKGNVDLRVGLPFGAAGMVGAAAGGTFTRFLSGEVLLVAFAGLMIAAAAAMLRGRREATHRPPPPAWRIALDGLGLGVVTGLVGAGGGFLLVPALTERAGLPMRRAVGTSLLVIAMNTSAGLVAHLGHTALDLRLTAVVTVAAVAGSFVGARLAQGLPERALRRGFAVFVLGLALFQIGMTSAAHGWLPGAR